MKKLLTLVAAAFMVVNVSVANKVLKITGTADTPGADYSRQCFINLKNVQKGKPNVVKFDVYTTAGTEFTIGTEAIDDIQTDHKNEWNNSAVFSNTGELTLTKTKSEAVIHFPGKANVSCHSHCNPKEGPGIQINHAGGNTNDCYPENLMNFEYAASALLLNIGKLPKDAIIYIDNVKVYDEAGNCLFTEDFENATVAADAKTNTVYYPGWQYGAIFEIADENATYIPSVDLADLNFSKKGATAIGGWGEGLKTEIKDGVEVITLTKKKQPHEVQVNFENVYPKGAKIRLTMVAKGSDKGSINAALQNPNGWKGCGDFGNIELTTDYQTFKKTVLCSGDNARRLLLNVGQYVGTISIESVKIEALDVPQETVTISPSGYSTYAAYYPVNYADLNLTAYAVKLNKAKDGVEFTEIPGVVPAGVPVLLKGIAGNKYVLEKAEGGSPVSTNLKMSDGNATSTDAATLYALSTKDGVTAFYRVKKDSPIPAKRCYLEVVKDTSASNAAFYSLGTNFGETTGISSVENKVEKADAPVYNLAGQLVGKDYKGLVIKNGKKFVIK